MSKVASKEAPDDKRLVLGFDGGCMACSDLARRIEEQVGDRLEIRSLREPQVEEWRERALGKGASWAPTLIEVKGSRLRVWTGWQLGINLSRSLGPIATWRVLQVLGELDVVSRANESSAETAVASISRARFLKGVGGMAVAMSLLAGTGGFPLAAAAARSSSSTSTGTPADRNKAKAIVRSSREFKKLASEQRQALGKPGNGYGSQFDFKHAKVRISNDTSALVGVSSYDKKRSVVAIFLVHLSKKTVVFYRDLVIIPAGDRQVEVTRREQGQDAHPYHRLTIGDSYIITQDGRRMSYQQFMEEATSFQHGSRVATVQSEDYGYIDEECYDNITSDCNAAISLSSVLLDLGLAFYGFAASTPSAGTAYGAALDSTGACENAANSTCYVEPTDA